MIQKNLKQKYYRRKYLEARQSIINVQSFTRGYLARKEAQQLRTVKAATTIQRVWRGSKQREAYHTIRNSVVSLQADRKSVV